MSKLLKYIIAGLLLPVLFFSGCQTKVFERVSWNTDLAIPLAQGRLDIHDLVPDSNIQVQQDGHVWLIYKNPIYRLNLADEYIEIPDTSLKQKVSLDSLELPNRSIYFPITLGQIAKADNSGTGALIIQFNGQTFPIPAFGGAGAENLPIDATQLFESAEIKSGFMDLNIKNGLPVPITDLEFTLKNESDGSVIAQDQIARIDPGETVSRTYDLSGKSLEGQILVDIENINSPGSNGNPVHIDTSDALDLTITVRDLELNSAEAIFPAQNLVNVAKEVIYDMKGSEFTFLAIRSGTLVISAFNTIEDSLYLNYQIPGAIGPSGLPINENTVVPPGSASQVTQVDKEIDLSGYTIDLTGKDNNRVNTFYNELKVRIDSTGKLIFISLNDSVSVGYGLVDIVPEYVEGYVGKESIKVGPTQQQFSVFERLDGGELDFEQIDVAFRVYNPLGVDAMVKVNYLEAEDGEGNITPLNAPFIGSQMDIARAFQNPFQPGITDIKLNEQNSNIDELIESQPHQLNYAIDMNVNPQGNRLNYQDFVNFNSIFEVSLDMEIPMSVIAKDLVLSNESSFDFKEPEGAGALESVTLKVNFENSFPLSASSQIYLYDGKMLIDSLFTSPAIISGASVDPNSCRTTQSNSDLIEVEIPQERINNLKNADRYVFQTKMNTNSAPAGCNDHIKIYSDYFMDIEIGSILNYKVGE